MESRNTRKASRHLRRAQELLNHQLFGFGVGSDPEPETRKRSHSADKPVVDTEPNINIEKEGEKNLITVTQRNAIIYMSVPGETWTANIVYPTLNDTFTSDVHILHMYASNNLPIYAAPEKKRKREIGKGQVTKGLLCHVLQHLIDTNFGGIGMNSVVSAEVDESPDDKLMNKVYRPMGFELRARTYNEDEQITNATGGLMTSTVKEIMAFCER
jgi:hypothetical protein